MQQMVKQPPTKTSSGSAGVQSVLITAITLFALSGLMVGFAFGAFNHMKQSQMADNNNHNKAATAPALAKKTSIAASPTVDVAAVGIGCPAIDASTDYTYAEQADGATPYAFSAQAVDNSTGGSSACGGGKPLYAPDLMCRIWITKDQDSLNHLYDNIKKLPDDQKAAIINSQGTIPGEEVNGLVMSSGSTQIQPCSSTGKTTWHYTLAPTLQPGNNWIAVMVGWHGRTNVSWRQIFVAAKK